MNQRADTYGLCAILGGGLLIVGATLLDTGRLTGQPQLETFGNLVAALAGLISIGLPLGLRAVGILPRSVLALAGTVAWGFGIASHILVDLVAVVAPANSELSAVLDPLGLLLLSLGFLAWFVAIKRQQSLYGWRKWLFLLAGLWFLTFPTIQLPFFIIPGGSPLMLLLPGIFGLIQFLMGQMVRERAGRAVPTRV
jgi:lysylphosphatidylglycerol synthetase-like protein (DUF2156 family)